ncbi:hypothetical protein [Sphingobacterium multivorum]|uniref:hypothetical protein n=1 Tax=Sphingobacterium multivorum TaxID=28454 RepID=UPI00289C7DCE|nr:hypothetical protein [Sphingobacterium multivorum]
MISKFNLNTCYHSPFRRMSLALIVMLIGFVLVNAAKLYRFTPLTFTLLTVPYELYFCILYLGYRIVIPHRKYYWFGLVLILACLVSSYPVVKYYFYDLVPHFIEGFSAPWLPEHKPVLIAKIITAILFFIVIYAADYFGWEKFYINLQFKAVQKELKDRTNVQLLSGHFLRKLHNILNEQSITVRSSSLDFFQYVSDKIANPKVLVPVGEEWAYSKRLISYSKDRSFIVEGEEFLNRKVMNRSIPTLTIMTWIENAIAYSPDDPAEYIRLKWLKTDGGLQLQICNRIASDNLEKGTGKGLELVNKLFETMKSQLITLEYTIQNQKYFMVTLTFNNQ